eukprot:6079911-Prymnesium_polylepis.1
MNSQITSQRLGVRARPARWRCPPCCRNSAPTRRRRRARDLAALRIALHIALGHGLVPHGGARPSR